MENDWPKEELDFANHQLISILNNSARVYHKVQTTVDQVGNKKRVVKLVQNYKNVCNGYKGWIVYFQMYFQLTLSPPNVRYFYTDAFAESHNFATSLLYMVWAI